MGSRTGKPPTSRSRRARSRAADDQADVRRRAAHVERDRVLVAGRARDPRRADDARGRARDERNGRMRGRLVELRDAARRAHHERRRQAAPPRNAPRARAGSARRPGPRYASIAVVDARSYSRNSGAISCEATTCASGRRRRTSAATARSCDASPVGVQEADRDRLGVELGQRVELERLELSRRARSARARRTQRSSGTSGSGCCRAQPVERGAVLAPQVQQVLEARVRDERRARALALEQRVRRDRRPVREAIDALGADRARGRDDGLLLLRRRRNLRRADLAVAEEDGVGERSSYIDAEHAHEANDRRVAARRRRRRAGRLPRTLASHGVASLPPSRIDEEAWTLEVTLPSGRGARTVRVSEGRAGQRARRRRDEVRSLAQLRHMFRLDEDLSAFYAVARDDPTTRLGRRGRRSHAAQPDGLRGRRQDDLHDQLRLGRDGADGHRARRPPRRSRRRPGRRTFPTPAAMAEAGDDFYRDVARAGYRGAYLRKLADDVASGALDLERAERSRTPRRGGRGAAARAARASARTRRRT